jgi:hypothetical protein
MLSARWVTHCQQLERLNCKPSAQHNQPLAAAVLHLLDSPPHRTGQIKSASQVNSLQAITNDLQLDNAELHEKKARDRTGHSGDFVSD